MTERPEFGIQEFRETVRTRVDEAWADKRISVVTRHGQAVAALVPIAYLEAADAALAAHGEPWPT